MILIRENQYGDIDLAGHRTLRSFPLRKVKMGLWLSGCPLLRSLPATLEVVGSLDLEGCASLTRLPTTLRVGGNLWVRHNSVTELPDDLEVGWGLWLQGSKIKHVPDSAKIRGLVYDLRSHVLGGET